LSGRSTTRLLLAATAVAVCGWFVSPAGASQLIDRDATGVRLTVNADGEALVQYTVGGHVRHVLA